MDKQLLAVLIRCYCPVSEVRWLIESTKCRNIVFRNGVKIECKGTTFGTLGVTLYDTNKRAFYYSLTPGELGIINGDGDAI